MAICQLPLLGGTKLSVGRDGERFINLSTRGRGYLGSVKKNPTRPMISRKGPYLGIVVLKLACWGLIWGF